MTADTIIAALCLSLFGILYASFVRRLRRRTNGRHGQTAWLVAFGVAVVVAVFSALTDAETAQLLILLFAAAGLPMIVEYIDDHSDLLHRLSVAANIDEMERRRDGL